MVRMDLRVPGSADRVGGQDPGRRALKGYVRRRGGWQPSADPADKAQQVASGALEWHLASMPSSAATSRLSLVSVPFATTTESDLKLSGTFEPDDRRRDLQCTSRRNLAAGHSSVRRFRLKMG
jgi:hypothetical protein